MPRFEPSDSRSPLPGHGRPVENYTNAFLVTAGALLFCLLGTLWAVWGLLAPLAAAWALDRAISRLSRRSRR
jgi:hypothetical protein